MIATVVIAIATVVYVCLTYKLLKSTDRPEVAVFLDFKRTREIERYICVQNVGSRAARNIQFEGNFSFTPLEGMPLSKVNFLENGINVLVPKQKIRHLISIRRHMMEMLNDFVYGDSNSVVEIKVKYQDFEKKEYTDRFQLDFRELNYYSDQQSDTQ